MSIHAAITHVTHYKYDRPVNMGPQVIRLRPAPHARTPVVSYSLKVEGGHHFLNWQQDPYGNWLARAVFTEKIKEFKVTVDLVAEMAVFNPFDFFVEDYAEKFPFVYEEGLRKELEPCLELHEFGPKFDEFVASVDKTPMRTVLFLVALNQKVQEEIGYVIRMEPGIQTPEETLTLARGSCRDSAWLMVNVLRRLGLAARFASGYLIQLAPDVKALDGPSGTEVDFTDLHAWCEVFLPGAGWVGFDPTSGLLCGEGHIPLACSPDPTGAAPISGALEECETEFDFAMGVSRIWESPRVTKPYSREQWAAIEALGHEVDRKLKAGDVRLTMGGEPTFVSIDDPDGDEWNFTALSPRKRDLGLTLLNRLRDKFAPNGFLHFGQGKWYPGEPLPRWAYKCHWRKDGEPLWRDNALVADGKRNYGHGSAEADAFIRSLADRLGVSDRFVIPGFEDKWYYMWKERRFPVNVDVSDAKLADKQERERIARIWEQGLGSVVGYTLPLCPVGIGPDAQWVSGPWFFRSEEMFLTPGDSPMGFRLPLDSLGWVAEGDMPHVHELDPMQERPPLPRPQGRSGRPGTVATEPKGVQVRLQDPRLSAAEMEKRREERRKEADELVRRQRETLAANPYDPMTWITRTALCVEPREGRLHVFMPPVRDVENYIELIARIEDTAAELGLPVMVEGYPMPNDPRIENFSVTPDPGVIEVNTHPTGSWDDLVRNTQVLYEEARLSRLGTEKFMPDGRHTGTGGGNHIIIGGETPSDSPLLRRPDLLRSLAGYWQNHPALSYLFSGLFIGPTSQAPRVDEARNDALYEMKVAFSQIPQPESGIWTPPWLVDRILRNVFVDLTGNTHRAEFCLDKLYPPEFGGRRLGLLEMRAFEMPPHAEMSLTQHLLLRSLVARFWNQPYRAEPVTWGTQLHDRFMLPHFVEQDMEDVIADLRESGYPLEKEWFDPHLAFKFPKYGDVTYRGVNLELRQALEPWHTLGEESVSSGTARYVDSSVERLQAKVRGLVGGRHVLTCNGKLVPLHPTGTEGEFVAGIRYRAWCPPSAMHPTIGIHSPLTFDVHDTWNSRALGGCMYYVEHPGGQNDAARPVNAYSAEGRRLGRFLRHGHTPGKVAPPAPYRNEAFPFTLDMRTT